MANFEGDAGVQEMGCLTLGNLAAHNAENAAAIAAAGGIAAVIAGMGRFNKGDAAGAQMDGFAAFEGEAGVQANGCGALAELALNNAENHLSIAAAGGIAAVIGGMGQFEGHAGVQFMGCMALFNLSFKGKARPAE